MIVWHSSNYKSKNTLQSKKTIIRKKTSLKRHPFCQEKRQNPLILKRVGRQKSVKHNKKDVHQKESAEEALKPINKIEREC